ncbi:Alpha/Beta hydrolase protein [Pholiota molesta]|nr:Alpha/Beta hydrolase protein [Pholiota molesta]
MSSMVLQFEADIRSNRHFLIHFESNNIVTFSSYGTFEDYVASALRQVIAAYEVMKCGPMREMRCTRRLRGESLRSPDSVSAAFGAPAAAPTINLGYATYQGILVQDPVTNQTNTNFLGVRRVEVPRSQTPAFTPGVQRPTPSRRRASAQGRAPRRDALRSGGHVVEHTRAGACCCRRAAGEPEDCLFLNVFAPGHLGSKKKLPVVVWIHGMIWLKYYDSPYQRRYVGGSASQYPGNDILREAGGGVVLVVIQYRLGLFGFLPGQKVKDGGVLNADSLISGIVDQQFALRLPVWRRPCESDHLGRVGWGWLRAAAYRRQRRKTTPPLFRAGITSSTFLPSQYAFNDRIPELLFSEVVSQTNCTSSKDSLECLRGVDVNTLQAANTEINASGFFGTFVFVPVVDGTFITARPTELLRSARFVQAVTNAFEGTYISQLFPNIGQDAIKAATALYAGLGTNIFQVDAIMGETIFICPTYFLMRAFGPNAFKGEFAIPPGTHGEDVAFYFPSGVPSFANPDFDKAFAESFQNFAMSLSPNVKWDPANITPLWKAWAGGTRCCSTKRRRTPRMSGRLQLRARCLSGAISGKALLRKRRSRP